METLSLLDLARNELSRGDKRKAREYLRQIIAQDKLNEEAWLVFADASQSRTDEYLCLQNVIKINPNNTIAIQRLQLFLNTSPPPKEKQNTNGKTIAIITVITLLLCMCTGSSTTLYYFRNDPRLLNILSIASPTSTPIPAQPFITNELNPLIIEFRNLDDLAESTPRNQLSSVIADLTKCSTKIKILQSSNNVPLCAKEGLSQIIIGEDGIIEGYQIFSGLTCIYKDGCKSQDELADVTLRAGRVVFDFGFDQLKTDCKGK